MDELEARRRLGLQAGAPPASVFDAHHKLASRAPGLPRDHRQAYLEGLDNARDVLLGLEHGHGGAWLHWVSSQQGIGVLTATGVALATITVFSNAKLAFITALAPLALGLALWASMRLRRTTLVVRIVLACALVASVFVVLRRVSDPGTHSFFYGGDVLTTTSRKSPFFNESSIPLTLDPKTGTADESIYPSDSTRLIVSCTQTGVFKHSRTLVKWAYIAEGNYQTYWVPVAYLGGIDPGEARILRPCSDWRWELQNLGPP